MADGIDHTDRIQVVEGKVDHLTERVQVLEVKVNEGFKAVAAAFVEQREYTEFAYSGLDKKMDAGFSRLDKKVDAGFSRLEAKMDAGDSRLDAKMDAGFSRLERKLDQFIDTQSHTNALVERRLNARAPRRRRS